MKTLRMKARGKQLTYHRLRRQASIMDQLHYKMSPFVGAMFRGVE